MVAWVHFTLQGASLLSLFAIRLRRAQRELLRDLEVSVSGSRARSRGAVSFPGNCGTKSRNSLTGAGHV